MSKKLRGSYYVDGRRSMTLTTSDDDKLVDIGFRLVYAAGDQNTVGCGWRTGPMFARVALVRDGNPTDELFNIGFRLTRENT